MAKKTWIPEVGDTVRYIEQNDGYGAIARVEDNHHQGVRGYLRTTVIDRGLTWDQDALVGRIECWEPVEVPPKFPSTADADAWLDAHA